jgi:addiction module RelE/StbE family toxin
MLEIRYHARFLKEVRVLPKPQQVKFARLLEVLAADPYDPRLHTKRLTGELVGVLSFRITRDWRVLFCFLNEDTIQLLTVGHRSSIYQ